MTTPLVTTGYYELIEGRHGRFLVNPKDIYIGRSLHTYGEFSELEWHMLDQVLQPGAIAVEAGANMGALTVPMANKIGKTGRLYAFEPQMIVFQQLAANLALNDIVNTQAFNAGCGAEPGWMSIIRPDPGREHNFGGFSLEKLEGETSIRIRIEALDDVLDVPRLNLIKADVEGMEVDVLKGAAELIRKHRPVLYLEANEDDAKGLIEYLMGIDYNMWWHLPPLFNPENHAGETENIFGRIKSKNILCLPAEHKTKVTSAPPVTGPDDHPNKWRK